MKVKVEIEIFDKTKIEDLDKLGLATNFIKVAYYKAISAIIEEMLTEGCEYSLDVRVEEN